MSTLALLRVKLHHIQTAAQERDDSARRAANPNQARESNGRFAPGSLAESEAKHPSLDGAKIGGEGYRAHREASRLKDALAGLKAKMDELHAHGDHAAADHVRANATWRGHTGYAAITRHYAEMQTAAVKGADKLRGDAKTRAALSALAHEYRSRLQSAGLSETDRARLTEELRLISKYGLSAGLRLDAPPAANGFPPLTKAERDSIRQQVAEALGQRRMTLAEARLRLAEIERLGGLNGRVPLFALGADGKMHFAGSAPGGPKITIPGVPTSHHHEPGASGSGHSPHTEDVARLLAQADHLDQQIAAVSHERDTAEAAAHQAWSDLMAAQRRGDSAAAQAAEHAYQAAAARQNEALRARAHLEAEAVNAHYHAAVAAAREETARTGQPAYAVAQDQRARAAARELFGRDLTPAELGALTGAEPGSYVRLSAARGGVFALVYGPGHAWNAERGEVDASLSRYTMQRGITREAGVLVIRNQSFMVDRAAQGQGIGARAVTRQVAQLLRLGGGRMTMYAGRGDQPPMLYNGYMTWPRLGYDGVLERQGKQLVAHQGMEDVLIPLPAHLRSVQTVQDIRRLDPAWWDEYGYSIDLSFNATPGSQNLEILNAYLTAKGLPPVA